MKIGFDLDNTIINYDFAFYSIARDKKWLPHNYNISKSKVKDILIAEDGNDKRWQELQSIAYGPEIKRASIHLGFLSFLKKCKSLNIDVIIISHKTKFSNYNPQIELRSAALEWLKTTDILKDKLIDEPNIYFCSTVEEKISKIAEERCDFFVDDLEKVLTHPLFPQTTLPFLFSNSSPQNTKTLKVDCWRDIQDIFEEKYYLSEKDYLLAYRARGEVPLKVVSLKRDGNNQILKCQDSRGLYVIKKYYSSASMKNNRGETEFSSLNYMYSNGISNIPQPILSNGQSAVYSFMLGSPLKTTPKNWTNIAKQLISFLASLKKLSDITDLDKLSNATDSRTRLSDYFSKIDERLKKIQEGVIKRSEFSEAKSFIDSELIPYKEKLFANILNQINNENLSLELVFPKEEKILSPSDFGLHNCLVTDEGHVNFIDFEYFGWDDPVKLLADFIFHAGHEVPNTFKEYLYNEFMSLFQNKSNLVKRFHIVSKLIEFEWILIVLNVLDPQKLERRIFANPNTKIDTLIHDRLCKALDLLRSARSNTNL